VVVVVEVVVVGAAVVEVVVVGAAVVLVVVVGAAAVLVVVVAPVVDVVVEDVTGARSAPGSVVVVVVGVQRRHLPRLPLPQLESDVECFARAPLI
jgi:hypothetical protein